MNRKNPRSVETTIRRLTREIAKIDALFYHVKETKDRELYAGMLERKRDDMVRSVVLQMHTSIENLLNSFIVCRTLNIKPEHRTRRMRSKTALALLNMLTGPRSIGFEAKLNFAGPRLAQLQNPRAAFRVEHAAKQEQPQLAFESTVETWEKTEAKKAPFTALRRARPTQR